jgi:hypothetical protein
VTVRVVEVETSAVSGAAMSVGSRCRFSDVVGVVLLFRVVGIKMTISSLSRSSTITPVVNSHVRACIERYGCQCYCKLSLKANVKAK